MKLQDELIKILLDKLAIGLLILFAGFLLNKSIEKLRSAETLKNELSKQRFATHLQRLERQLSEFYWPVYIRLQKDNTVWKRLLDKNHEEDDPLRKIGIRIEADFLLPNHKELVSIIESKIHLAEATPELQCLLLAYIDHVAVYNAAIAAGFTDLHNTQRNLLPPWPTGLFEAIERNATELQRTYDDLLAKQKQA